MELVKYEESQGVATITMDDGKVNALSPRLLRALLEALDRAEAAGAVALIEGRPGCFSAGFDMSVFQEGEEASREMLRLGATAALRILGFETPVVTAATGHAYPAGAFLMLAADRRLGAEGPFRIGLNETAIGLTLPLFAVELARYRLSQPAFHRVTTGDLYDPEQAVRAGFLDETVAPEALASRSREVAVGLTQIHFEAHYQTKLRIRGPVLAAMQQAIDTELGG